MGKIKDSVKHKKSKSDTHPYQHKKMADTSNTSSEKFTFFYTSESPFSQFYPCKFTIDGVTYNCAEQYMMHQKAVVFEDHEIVPEILKETTPGKIKAFGRKVKNFDDAVWTEKCKEIVRKGNMAKFTQNAMLREEIMATAGTTLVEASPRDCRWGIGLGASNPKAQDRSQWRGKNWLGEILTDVRNTIMSEDKSKE